MLQVFYYPQDAPLEMGANGGVARIPLPLLLSSSYAALQENPWRSFHSRARRLNIHHNLGHLAPPHRSPLRAGLATY